MLIGSLPTEAIKEKDDILNGKIWSSRTEIQTVDLLIAEPMQRPPDPGDTLH